MPTVNSSGQGSRNWVLALTSAASFMVVLDSQVVTTALSRIRLDLTASIEALEWTVNAYSVSFAVLLLTGAALGDRFGRRRTFIAGVGLFIVASAACAMAGSAGWLIAARALQGAGAALVMPLAMALLSVSFPGPLRARALGLFASITGLATIVGPVIGGAVAEGLSWHWIFWINVPVGLLIIALVLARIPETHSAASGTSAGFDFPGLVLVTGAALGVVWALVRGNSSGWGSAEIVTSLAAGTLLAAVWVVWEASADAPMVPLGFFRARAFSAGNAASFLFNGALYGTLFFMAQFLQNGMGYGPLGAGLRLLPWTATLFVVAPLAGAAVNRFGERPLVVAGLLLQAVGMLWIGLLAARDLPYADLVLPLIVAGAGVSMAMPATQNAVLGAVAPHEIGKASGTYNMLRFLGGVFGVAVTAALFARFGGFASPQAFSAGFVPAIGLAAALSLAGAIAGLWLPAQIGRASWRERV